MAQIKDADVDADDDGWGGDGEWGEAGDNGDGEWG